MGRGNAQERAARAAARLQAAAEQSKEIAEQALAAVDNGADPELVMSIASEAITQIEVLPETTAILESVRQDNERNELRKVIDHDLGKERQRTIRVIGALDGTSWVTAVWLDGIPYEIEFNPQGIATVPETVAVLLCNGNSYEFCD
jgi:hypothetical protein